LRALERRHAELRELAGARDRELDLLEFELGEIEALGPQEGEHERLLAARERLRRLDALQSAAGAAAEALAPDSPDTGAGGQPLAASISRLDVLAGVDPRLDALAERMHALEIESQDLAAELRDYCEGSSSTSGEDAGGEQPGEALTLDALEERLAMIERLARKHGGSIRAVLDYAATAAARREELLGADGALERTDEQLREARAELGERVLEVRRARKAAAKRLAVAVREQLAALAMADAGFEVTLAECEPGPSGADAVEFLIAPNPGVPAGPLRDIASGGELSRVMLAIMGVATESTAQATLVFDEVDAGIGGHTARAVGARLRELAERRQVLCITHLPQIASLGERHFSISKDTAAEPARTTVVELGETDVVSELVRMLGAHSDDSGAQRHARELRRAA
jgi:DNA repair protein RecN (Recombination protein N)